MTKNNVINKKNRKNVNPFNKCGSFSMFIKLFKAKYNENIKKKIK